MERKSKDFRISKYLDGTVRRLLLLLSAVTLALLTLALIIYTGNSAQAIERQMCERTQASVKQARNNIDYRLEQVAESTSVLMSTMYPQLTLSRSYDEQLTEYDELKRLMSELVGRQMITSLRLYVPDTKIYLGQQTAQYAFLPLSSLAGYPDKYEKGGTSWEKTQTVKLGVFPETQVISCTITVRSMNNFDQIAGILFADVDVYQFDEIFSAGMDADETMYLVDDRGEILAHKESTYIGQNAVTAEELKEIQKRDTGYIVGDDEILVFCKLQMAEWYLMTRVDRMRIHTIDTDVLATIVALWAAALFAMAVIVIVALNNISLNRTVSRINQAICALKFENEPKTNGTEAAEFALSGQKRKRLPTLERDAEQIVRLVADVVEARYHDKLTVAEYQMEALQAQIKPHFLYNTLDVIKWMIMDKNLEDGIWMVNSLSKYLRMSINKGEPIVPLEEEIALTRIYLGIMQKRFSGKFRVEYELAEDLIDCRIPKFSLQPLVENALLHGILHCEKPELYLAIRGWVDGDNFNIEVEDNGCGMPNEQAVSLAESEVGANKSYGIANVHKRLDIFARGECGFSIRSYEGVGTCVAIELPLHAANTAGNVK